MVTNGSHEQSESTTHSFIIKISIEKIAGETDQARWYGYLTHVPSEERRYFKDLFEILDFITPYLESAHVRLGAYHWLSQWHAWKTRVKKKGAQLRHKNMEER